MKMRTAASINPVINLSQSLKLAVIGLIVVNHACQWCGKVHGIPLQGEWMMKSERAALLWNSDGEVYSSYIYIFNPRPEVTHLMKRRTHNAQMADRFRQ